MTLFTAEHRLDGGTGPAAVFVSALFAGGWIWDHPYRTLSDAGWSVLRTRQPVCAVDSRVAGSIEALGDAMLAVCDEAGVGELVVCANSLGGLVAIDLARRFPDRVRGIVVSGAPGLTADPDVGLSMDRRAGVKPSGPEFEARMMAALFHSGRHFSDEQLAETGTLLEQPTSMLSMARSLRATRSYPVRATLDEVRCPSMYLWGRHDRMTPVDAWVDVVEAHPTSEMVLIEDCGHIPMLERGDEYSSHLARFMTQFASVPA
ncbi:pimeloyl-ACP methyl ester carboxylesterase [Actinoalloteichus hoggarensis]|uniref:4,5:9,10-diseco-3-hydroxy-5,9, 17-trioxoandrosta-1(10),2-diene-4-oate hydrolase n=1 Tax=Actinoalloteichus hoggarensis TaxID=1470176 RepID=A0A221VZ07_9PSEU|nr:alpha/beta hydrolase [Actinoalloteichus hoggarensis]ASO18757.1 4,5:9,10-diseco-3-hydroxy-5,9,17-trioxoandrosta-1(10),2-diene-4-oate hydrolase [Actinoalloteichus hoggarensis]MBB5919990.1 pimeloyl-ACP methyl ester carboxylesterase [Actinoalloteichus hoggarensis]